MAKSRSKITLEDAVRSLGGTITFRGSEATVRVANHSASSTASTSRSDAITGAVSMLPMNTAAKVRAEADRLRSVEECYTCGGKLGAKQVSGEPYSARFRFCGSSCFNEFKESRKKARDNATRVAIAMGRAVK